MANFSAEHPEYSHGLLAFALQILTFKFTACNALTPDDNVCDASCQRGQTEPCGCTCLMDAFAIPDEQVLLSLFLAPTALRRLSNEIPSVLARLKTQSTSICHELGGSMGEATP